MLYYPVKMKSVMFLSYANPTLPHRLVGRPNNCENNGYSDQPCTISEESFWRENSSERRCLSSSREIYHLGIPVCVILFFKTFFPFFAPLL